MSTEIAFDPDIFHGELTANRGQVFVRAGRTAELADCSLHGFVHGPRCEYAHTLPAKFPLNDLGAGPTLLARATITDPCYWTSDLPQIYDVHVELRRGGEVVAREQRMLGLRGIGACPSGELLREGKVWVPRGVAIELLQTIDMEALREHLLVGVCAAPPLDLLVEASRRGLYLISEIDALRQEVPAVLRRLARWPAVMMALIRNGETLERSLSQVAPNLLLAQVVEPSQASSQGSAPWAVAQVIALEAGKTPQIAAANGSLPRLIRRPASGRLLSASEARQECERLQRDLAAAGQFSAYLLGE